MSYGVWITQGQEPPETPDLEFPSLDKALEYVKDHRGEASFAISYPDGTFHDWLK